MSLTPPPPTPKSSVIDDYHGTLVPDPYRWLEDAQDPEVQTWTRAHNQRTRQFLDSIPALEGIKTRLTGLWDYAKYEGFQKAGGKYFLTKNDGLQNQAVLYIQDSLDSDPRVLLDPNTLSEDGTIALMQQSYSIDGSLLGYSLADSGSDWQKIHIIEIDTRTKYTDELAWCKHPNIAWKADNSGFFYNRLTEPGDTWGSDTQLLSQVFWHTLGTSQSADILIYDNPLEPLLRYLPITTEDKAYLVLMTSRGTDRRNGIYLRRLEREGEFQHIIEDGEAKLWPVGNVESIFYFLTDLDAPLGRVIAIDMDNPAREHWQEVVPEGENTLANVKLCGNLLVAVTLHNAHHRIILHGLDGVQQREIPLPAMGTVELLAGGQSDPEIFISFESFLYPRTIFRYDLETGRLSSIGSTGLDFRIQDHETEQVFYPSKDGTPIPMFLTHRKGMARNRNNPTILFAYGGFTLSQTPFFNAWNLVWLELGGIFALANIRGGTEYGEAWHQAGMLGNKQNVFDDFIAAAEWLISEGYTRTERLAIEGRSNGGLLTATCMAQRPDLYGAVLCWVPVTDMLRFHKFTVGYFWTPEYGNAEENPEHFKFLYAYSPLHNLKEDAAYPPLIITTGDTDDRVVPAHSKKFIAQLLDVDPGNAPHLLRVDLDAGHKLGKPTYKLIDEHADVIAFVVYALDMAL